MTGRYDTYRIFHIPVNFVSIYHIMLLAICTTEVKKREERRLKKKKKIRFRKFVSGVFEPEPSESVRTRSY